MVELAFDCLDIRPEKYGVSPTLLFRLRIAELNGARLHTIALRCQIRIEPQRRGYSGEEPDLLRNVFGDRSRWGETLKPMQFANVSYVVPSFTASTEIEIPVPCSYDMDVAAGQYFSALSEGVVPFTLLFSGTVFGKGENGFWVDQVPWHHCADIGMPISVWWEMMNIYFPGVSWLRLERSTVAALQRYKADHSIATWDAAIAGLLDEAKREHFRDVTP